MLRIFIKKGRQMKCLPDSPGQQEGFSALLYFQNSFLTVILKPDHLILLLKTLQCLPTSLHVNP